MPLTTPISPLSADLNFNSHKGTNVTDPTNAQDAGTKNYVDQAVAAISQNTGSQVISGCGVAWTGTGLQFLVSAGTYSINGTTYSVSQTTVTLDAADGSNPRIDLIIVDNTSTATKITGTPAASPVAPSVDPATQLQLTFVYVAAGATTPGVTNTLLYDENAGSPTEWASSSSGATWNLASTNNPYSGTKDIEATSVGTNAYAQLQKGSGTIDPSAQNQLVFYIRSKATWGNNRSLTIAFFNSGTQVGNGLSLRDGVFGFSSSNTSAYQQIVIPISNFNLGSSAVNQIRFIVAGSGGSIGFYLDLIQLQAGVTPAGQNFMVARGSWNSANAYAKNDTVVHNGETYVCLIPNSNSVPTETGANWKPYSSITDLRVLTNSYALPANSSKVYASSIQLSAGANLTIPSTSAVFITGSGSGPQSAASAPGLTVNIGVGSGVTSTAQTTLASKALTVSQYDQIHIEAEFAVVSNTAAGRTYTFRSSLGSFTVDFTTGAIGPSSAPTKFRIMTVFGVSASNKAWVHTFVLATGLSSINTQSSINTTNSGGNYNQTSSNLLGAQTASLKIISSADDNTQTVDLIAYKIIQTPAMTS